MIPDLIRDFEQYGEYVVLNRNMVDDGYGGYRVSYKEGIHFFATVILDNSIEMRQAQALGEVGIYNVTFEKKMRLPWHTVFRRISDGQIFRVTSKDDATPPSSSMIKTRITTAEEWELPIDE